MAYQKEYELGQRSLIDLLNAQNQLFNASVSLQSTLGVSVFADYQLLAAMGKLLDYLKSPKPIDAEPMPTRPFGLIPTKVFPILLKLPSPGSEPLNIGKGSDLLAPGGIVLTQQRTAAIDTRWPGSTTVAETARQWLGLDRAVANISATSTATPAPATAEAPPTSEAPAALSFAPSGQPTRPSLLFPTASGLLR